MQQDPLFPITAIETEGYAEPEPRDDETADDQAEADTGAEAA